MFDRIARHYDAMNSVMTAGLHHRWRERTADRAELRPGAAALDVCCGTGDLALELRRRVGASGRVTACDFSEPMLELGREKAAGLGFGEIAFEWADALKLPYPDSSFDAVTVGFGVRNLADLSKGIAEMARVLRPGGRLVILEITQPTRPPLSWFFSLWFDRVVPRLGTLAGDRDAYTYLPESVRRFPPPQGLAALMAEAGLRSIRYTVLAGGIVAIYVGQAEPNPVSRKRSTGRAQVPAAGGQSSPVTEVVEAAGAWLPARLAKVESRLAEIAVGYGPELASAAGSTLEAGGKRLRPLLVLLCAGPESPDSGAEAVRAAVAVELVHTATLVHDDVLDAAPLRRGRPTVVAENGRDRALATGDLLFSRAFAELAANGSERQVELLSEVSVGLALGELAQREDAYRTEIGEERYLERCRLKTARLFESACLLGWDNKGPFRASAQRGGRDAVSQRDAPVRGERELAEFGRCVGLAFQLLDDVLDVSGPPERTGKARGTDLLDGTVTLPLILAAGADPGIADTDLRQLDATTAEALCDRIAASGALEEVRARGLALVSGGKRALAAGPFSESEKRLLGLVADGVVERYA